MENRLCMSQIIALNKEGGRQLDNMVSAFELVMNRTVQAQKEQKLNRNNLSYNGSTLGQRAGSRGPPRGRN